MLKLNNNGIPNNLSVEEATGRIKNALNKHNSKISILNQIWNGAKCDLTIKVGGVTYSGTLIIEQKKVKISGNLPPIIGSMIEKVLTK